MKILVIIPLMAAACLIGCSRRGLSTIGPPCSGNLTFFMMECVTNRGGNASAKALPAIEAQWRFKSSSIQDIIAVSGNHISEIQSILQQAYGNPNPATGPAPEAATAGGWQWGSYDFKQAGVSLDFAGDTRQTVITIGGHLDSSMVPPKPSGGTNGWQFD